MTENEAIKEIETSLELAEMCKPNREREKEIKAYKMAIQALTEIQQYRAIGTVERFRFLQEVCDLTGDELEHIANSMIERKNYRAIGTIEELQALKEKSVAKKPIKNDPKINEFYVKEANLCPSCHSYINNCSGDYCRDCAQKLDWND